MLATQKFFGAIDYLEYQNLSSEDRQLHLIEKSIYSEIDNSTLKNFNEKKILIEYTGNQIDFLCEPLTLNGVNYFLSKEFLSEVFDNTISHFEYYQDILDKLKNQNKASIDIFLLTEKKDEYLLEKYDAASKQYISELSNNLFYELHLYRDSSRNKLEGVLKNNIKYCKKDLSHYIFGHHNLKDFYTNGIFYTFCRLNNELDFCYENLTRDPRNGKTIKSQSHAKVVAILNEIGFFNLDFVKNLGTDEARHKIIAMLLKEDYDNDNLLRDVRGNVHSLNKYKMVDRDRFKASSHVEKVKKMLNELK